MIEAECRFDQECGQGLRVIAEKLLVSRLYLDNFSKIDNLDLPHNVLCYLKEDFSRILKLTYEDKNNFVSFQNPQFYKYLETLQFRLFPLGNQGIMVSGFPRNILFKQSFLNFIKLSRMLLRLGGNRPFYEFHFNPHRLRQFNQDGWNNVFKLAAEMLLRQPAIKGIFSSAWFFDPHIVLISPELTYIQTLIEKIGGQFFFQRKVRKIEKMHLLCLLFVSVPLKTDSMIRPVTWP